ncbi:MAG: Bax inhibitor-1/YccA family protein [Paludibacterium sp.]|uniref:Bax inhibitor-1/YccA family protein n=1 Tax=Paludibacterium sp. TaxID=1917523 RepID=UPI0025E966D5|nr:Bax inhibitor-1/YccA family protein [Paludibacterium sp.]MBV8049377.1 Bax inhibitor-1/YccA family protein [Paludibacterium sp.]MBV8647543.1 Bax inhibitor-1/YccA family protein [Paludibacterium sp.]
MQPNLQTAYSATLGDARQKVLRNTYALLGLSLIPTVIGALIGTNLSFMFLRTSPIMGMLLMLAGLYGLMFAIEKNRYSPVGAYLMFAFTFLMGILLGPLLQVALRLQNGPGLIMVAGGATSLIFLVMATIGATTKRDLSGVGSFLSAGFIVLMVAMIANIFLRIPMFQLVIAAGFALFSALIIMYQVKQVVAGGETSYISAALTIYVSIYNLFTSLLQILIAVSGNNRN